jgi:hypothetical protein
MMWIYLDAVCSQNNYVTRLRCGDYALKVLYCKVAYLSSHNQHKYLG